MWLPMHFVLLPILQLFSLPNPWFFQNLPMADIHHWLVIEFGWQTLRIGYKHRLDGK
jgi:hypothetical protein